MRGRDATGERGRAGGTGAGAEIGECGHVQRRLPGMGIFQPLGQFGKFAEKTAPDEAFQRERPRRLKGKAREIRRLDEGLRR